MAASTYAANEGFARATGGGNPLNLLPLRHSFDAA
jgi:hypothetical protein